MKRMKEYCKICLLLLGALTIWGPKAMAQNVKTQNNENSTVVTEQAGTNEKIGENLNDKVLNEKPVNEAVGGSSFAADRAVEPSFLGAFGGEHTDSLNLPAIGMRGEVLPMTLRPLYWGNWYNWSLHKGMNVSLGASVFAEFGKNARGGAGFTQNVSAMYAVPVTKKLSVAVGGYLNNINYAGGNWRDAGLSAVVGYRFNEHWEAYVYGQKSLTNNIGNRLRYSMYDGYYGGYYGPGMGGFGGFSRNFFGIPAYSVYDLSNMGDRIGATVRYNVNNNLSIEVSVENRWLPSR